MDEYVSLALDVEAKGVEMLKELNWIKNNSYARKAKSLLLELMESANRALEGRCPSDDPFGGFDDVQRGSPSGACCRGCEDAWKATRGSGTVYEVSS